MITSLHYRVDSRWVLKTTVEIVIDNSSCVKLNTIFLIQCKNSNYSLQTNKCGVFVTSHTFSNRGPTHSLLQPLVGLVRLELTV